MADLNNKKETLIRIIRESGSMAVCYSGGVDSALLAFLAKKILGDRSCCIIADSPLLSGHALAEAKETADSLCLDCEIVPFPVLEDEEFQKNHRNRCYICRKLMFALIREHAEERGMACIAEGTTCSDLGKFRPGLVAGEEEGTIRPFVDAGMTRDDVLQMAKDYGMPFWNRPSDSCLATRLPYGTEIIVQRLEMIETAEDILRTLGCTQIRVRMHGSLARIEVMPDEMHVIIMSRLSVTRNLKKIGFTHITLDLEGYRSGSMDVPG